MSEPQSDWCERLCRQSATVCRGKEVAEEQGARFRTRRKRSNNRSWMVWGEALRGVARFKAAEEIWLVRGDWQRWQRRVGRRWQLH